MLNQLLASTQPISPQPLAHPPARLLDELGHDVRSSVSCPGRSRWQAISISTASWPSSCAEPMCSIPTTSRPCLCTICTARAPDAVGTFRMNEVTREATNHPISHPEHPTKTTSTQLTDLPPTRMSEGGTSQTRAEPRRTRGHGVSGLARLESRWTTRQQEMSAGTELPPAKGVPVWRDRLGYLVLGVLLGMAATLWLLNQLGFAPHG